MATPSSAPSVVPPARPPPRFSVEYMDRQADPTTDFYAYANGTWQRTHPIPADRVIWGAFGELRERNVELLGRLLEEARAAAPHAPPGASRQVGVFYQSAMDTDRIEKLGLGPLQETLGQIDRVADPVALTALLGELHPLGVDGLFEAFAIPDWKQSDRYALYMFQGGLSLPDREYYRAEQFAEVRREFGAHVARMLRLVGDSTETAAAASATIVTLESELADASRSRTDLRDRERNYHRVAASDLPGQFPGLPLDSYLAARGVQGVPHVVVGQPEFFTAVGGLLARRPISEWKAYVRWQLLHAGAPYLSSAVEAEDFAFFHRTLLGQPTPEPRWKKAVTVVDEALGEALGQLFVAAHFPPEAKARMDRMVGHLRAVFFDRLRTLDWMSPETRRQAVAKFERFVARIGHPDTFRDYSSIRLDPGDYLGNVQRAAAFDARRRFARIGERVDPAEWGMTPPTVNAYFDPTQNEIFFPAGILQPPFFDATLDDAVNYGGIGAVIGHEITHGYDDQGRKSDAEGNLRDWWTAADAAEFTARAREVVALYAAVEPLPGVHVNGELTLGENIADLGGISLAYEALQRRLAEAPDGRRPIDGFTPEQRFFLSWAQVWRTQCREEALRQRLTVDTHAPGSCRAVTPLRAFPPFHAAFPSSGPAPGPLPPTVRIW